MPETERHIAEHLTPLAAPFVMGMVRIAREHLSVSLTIPVYWMVGVATLVLMQAGVVIWKVSSFVSAVDTLLLKHEITDRRIEAHDASLDKLAIEIVRQAEVDQGQTFRLNAQGQRMDRIEARVDQLANLRKGLQR